MYYIIYILFFSRFYSSDVYAGSGWKQVGNIKIITKIWSTISYTMLCLFLGAGIEISNDRKTLTHDRQIRNLECRRYIIIDIDIIFGQCHIKRIKIKESTTH